MMPKRPLLVWADKIALFLALFIAVGALSCWTIGIVGLEGLSHQRFDSAMLDWAATSELMLVPPLWLVLRLVDFGAKMLGRRLRLGHSPNLGKFA